MTNLYTCAIFVQQQNVSEAFITPGYVEADSEAEAYQAVMSQILKQYPSSEGFYNYNVRVSEIPKKDIVAFIGKWARLMLPLNNQSES